MAEGKSSTSGVKILLKTSMGDITLQLYEDTPITSGNFQKLVEKGFYDGVIFHRIIDGFMIQGGDPTGTGPRQRHQGRAFPQEQERSRYHQHGQRRNIGGSQFFINLVNNNFLDSKHPVFGKVVEGMDVVDAMAKVKKGANDKPVKDVKMSHPTSQ